MEEENMGIADNRTPLRDLIQRCQQDIRDLCGHENAAWLARWQQCSTDRELVRFIQRLIWNDHARIYGRRIAIAGGLSLELIVLNYWPELFTQADIKIAQDTLRDT
jgi:hypothetical protein